MRTHPWNFRCQSELKTNSFNQNEWRRWPHLETNLLKVRHMSRPKIFHVGPPTGDLKVCGHHPFSEWIPKKGMVEKWGEGARFKQGPKLKTPKNSSIWVVHGFIRVWEGGESKEDSLQKKMEDGRDRLEATTSGQSMLVMGACTQCLMYVMLNKCDPKCPRCKSQVPLDFTHATHPPPPKRQRRLERPESPSELTQVWKSETHPLFACSPH